MKDRIRIEGIEFYGFHGVSAAEREVGHRFRADVELELDLRAAGTSDDLAQTVDYGAAARVVLEIGTGASAQLVETLAERMAERLLAEFPRVEAVELWVAKLHPPAPLPFAAAEIHVRRVRAS
jgi:dihydroneopterin aldolase